MEFWKILLELVITLAVAVVLGAAMERLRQSAILGYLLAGVLLGPNAFHLVSNAEFVTAAAELGVILLLFSIGLEFSWSRLRSLGAVAGAGGALQLAITIAVTAVGAVALGLSVRGAIAIGAVVALSSTASVLRLLSDRGELESPHGRNTLGILLLQDLAVVPLVLLVTTLGDEGSLLTVVGSLSRTFIYGCIFVITSYVLISKVLPRFLHVTSGASNRELPILLGVVVFMASAWMAHAIGLSAAMGAFTAGVLLAESPFAVQIRADVAGLRTLFVTLFFVSIGMLANPAWSIAHLPSLLGLVGAIVVGKAAIVWALLRGLGGSHRHGLATGLCLAQVGEFSFILTAIAMGTGLLSHDVYVLLTSATIISLLLTPYLVAVAPHVGLWAERRLIRGTAAPGLSETSRLAGRRGHVIVVGFGPAGRGAVEALSGLGVPTVVVELSSRWLTLAGEIGVEMQLGDATSPEVLEAAGIHGARAVVVTIPDNRSAGAVVQLVRALSPATTVVARARQHVFAVGLGDAGAEIVVDEEVEVGKLLGRHVQRVISDGYASSGSGP